jgi:hypothetical protein
MHDFYIKRGDTRPAIKAQLREDFGDPRDLSDATEVRFHMESVDTGDVIVDEPASIINADDGRVTYAWQDGDTDAVGRYSAEFEVEYTDGNVETFPNNTDITVSVDEDIA